MWSNPFKKSSVSDNDSQKSPISPSVISPPAKFEVTKTCIICKKNPVTEKGNNENRCGECIAKIEYASLTTNLEPKKTSSINLGTPKQLPLFSSEKNKGYGFSPFAGRDKETEVSKVEREREGYVVSHAEKTFMEIPTDIKQSFSEPEPKKTETGYGIYHEDTTVDLPPFGEKIREESSEGSSESYEEDEGTGPSSIITKINQKLTEISQSISELQTNYQGLKNTSDNHANSLSSLVISLEKSRITYSLDEKIKSIEDKQKLFLPNLQTLKSEVSNTLTAEIKDLETALKKAISENNSVNNQNITASLENRWKEYEAKLEEAIKAIPTPKTPKGKKNYLTVFVLLVLLANFLLSCYTFWRSEAKPWSNKTVNKNE